MSRDSVSSGTGSNSIGSRINRRSFIVAGGAAAVSGLAGCTGGGGSGGNTDTDSDTDAGSGSGSGATTTADSSTTIRVSVWSGDYAEYFRSTVKKLYEEETGNTMEVIPGWNEILSKIKAAPEDNPPYDLTVTDGYFYYAGRQDDLFEPVDYDNVPNIDNVYPYLKEFRPTKYGAPTDGSPMSIIYDKTRVDDAPSNWGEFGEHDADKGMEGGFYVYPIHCAAIAAQQEEGAQELYSEDTIDVVYDTLRDFDVDAWYGSGAEVWEFMRQGRTAMSQWYFDGVVKAEEVEEYEAVVPTQTTAYFDHYCPVRGSDKKAEAENVLNFMLRPEIQTAWHAEGKNMMSTEDVEYSEIGSEYHPKSNEAYQKISFPDWTKLSEYSGKLSEEFSKVKSS
ncbi:ABC transporter substrate-binding protein [Halobellus marinus]|uniref:ABC transporter substrate-binding protein n=1 Tax=Halobellus TaxID=1073986 RepID=UPI0028AF9CDE|nr:extracellular solute-binding protein [Halobellus sp. DFY28]